MEEKRGYFYILLLSILFFPFICIASPDNYKLITTYFIELDENFNSVRDKIADAKKYKEFNVILQDFINKYPSIDFVVRTNRDAERTNKIERTTQGKYKVYGNRYSFIGRQQWYKVIKLTKDSYYSGRSGKTLKLFWGKPIIQNKRFYGTIAMELDLKRFFAQLAKEKNVRYKITYEGKTYFSNLVDNPKTKLEDNKLSVFGMPGLTVTYEVPKPKPIAVKKTVIDTVKKIVPKEPKKQRKPLIPGNLDTKNLLLFGGGTIFIFALCIVALTTITKKQAEKASEGDSIL